MRLLSVDHSSHYGRDMPLHGWYSPGLVFLSRLVAGVASYAAPVLSTALLILTGYATADWSIALAALLVAGGAALAALDLFRRR